MGGVGRFRMIAKNKIKLLYNITINQKSVAQHISADFTYSRTVVVVVEEFTARFLKKYLLLKKCDIRSSEIHNGASFSFLKLVFAAIFSTIYIIW